MSHTQHQWFLGYAIKQKAPENFWTAAILLFYILQKYYPPTVMYFYKVHYQDLKVNGASVTHVTPVHHVNTHYRTREITALLCSTVE